MFKRIALLFGLILTAQPAAAQMLMLNYGGGAGAASIYSGPGDVVGSAQFFGGVRAYSKAITDAGTQKLVNVVRASDSHACDIIVSSSGGLGNTGSCGTGGDNGQSASSFCNATTCAVATVYDQSGHSLNATQGTGANRPTLTFNCIGSLPCLRFTTNQAVVTGSATFGQPNTISIIAKRTGLLTSQGTLAGSNGNAPEMGGAAQVNTWFMYAGTQVNVTSVSDNVWHAANFNYNGASSVANVDGAEQTPNPGASGANSTLFWGNGNWNGDSTEFGMWAVGFTGTQRTNMCKNQQAYYGGSGNFGAAC